MILSARKSIAGFFVTVLVGVPLLLMGMSAPVQSAALQSAALQSATVQKATLRLMPIGDSITSGYKSSTNNGYRGPLWSALINQGDALDMVGSIRDGVMFDPDHEGHSGYRIDQVASLLNGALSTYQPNLVTLHIGSNDMNQNYQVSTAPNRLTSMIDQILAAAPSATILVAQLICNSDAAVQSRINAYNSQIPGIVWARANAGKHVYMVSMSSLNTGDLEDGLHPNDTGYQKMANAWGAAIQQVIAKGWVSHINFAGTYEIQSVSSGQVLDVSAGSTANGATVVQWSYGGASNQLWNFIPTSNGYYQIRNAYSGLDLNVSGASKTNGAKIVQWQFGSQSNDQWRPVRQIDGSYVFYNRNSGLLLDNPGGTTQGVQFDQSGANSASNQRFRLITR